jgi:hypothetical protein
VLSYTRNIFSGLQLLGRKSLKHRQDHVSNAEPERPVDAVILTAQTFVAEPQIV